MFFLLACTEAPPSAPPPKESTPVPVDTQDSEPPGPPDGTVQGSVSTEDGETATIVSWHAFSYANSNAALVYLSSAPDATCDMLTEALFRQGDPSGLFAPETCNLQILVPSTLPFDYSFDSATAATFQLLCPFGSGGWSNQNNAWRWGGRWYVGNALGGQVSLSSSGSIVNGTIDLENFSGSYPYEAGTPTATMLNPISGNVIGESCEGLGIHPVFQ